MATRKKATPEETPVVAEEYSDGWDGTETADAPTKRRGRQVSPLIQATRAYEKAMTDAAKARERIAKVQPLIDSLKELEAAENEAYAALQEMLSGQSL